MQTSTQAYPVRQDWRTDEVVALFQQPLNDLIFQAQNALRAYFDPNSVQLSSLLNIKTGACPEDCAYCPQSARYDTDLEREPLLDKAEILNAALRAQAAGATRFCMGAAWRQPRSKEFPQILDIVRSVKALGLETCLTLGMLDAEQSRQLKEAGLDYYNHNIDTSENFYPQIISTRTFQDRLDTLEHVRDAEIKVCCGGIIGMGETLQDRAEMLVTLANLPQQPESVPINQLVKISGTPLADGPDIDPFDMVRCIAVARLMMPASYVRLSAGRGEMSEAMQTLCLLAGANSIFYGDKLLTTDNPEAEQDRRLLKRLGMRPVQHV